MNFADYLTSFYLLAGKLHPVAVHLPIGLILYVALIELFYLLKRNRGYSLERSLYPYAAASFFAIVAALFGWANAANQEFQGELADIVELHRWGGVGVTVLSIIITLIGYRALKTGSLATAKIFRASAIFSALMIGGVSHFGGMMVHGTDYYEDLFVAHSASDQIGVAGGSGGSVGGSGDSSETNNFGTVRTSFAGDGTLPQAVARKVSYEDDVHPIFQASCYKCHGEGKRKGDYNLDSLGEMLKGGKSKKPSIVIGNSEASYLIELVSGLDPENIMPNKGRRLTAQEVGVLRAWIDQGAKWGEESDKPQYRVPKVGTEPRRPELPESALVNPIDKILDPYFKAHSVEVGGIVDDRTFARRVYLDLVGEIPHKDELIDFLSDTRANKRELLIDKLLGDRYRYAIHWMTFWNDALRNDYSGPGFLLGNRREITQWLFKALYNNTPYNEFVKQLVSPAEESVGFVRGIRWWSSDVVNANEEPGMQAAQNIAQVFMGVNLKCASCHSSFTDDWTLSEAYGFANAIASRPLTSHECNISTGQVVAPAFLYPELGEITARGRAKRRAEVANILTSERNGRFARTIVNRLWEKLYGVGIVEPIDELDHIPWNQDLLDWLASEFVAYDYDLKKLLKLMAMSQAYQLSAVQAYEKHPDDYVFKGPAVKRLSVEQFLDSVSNATDIVQDAAPGDVERAMSLTLSVADTSDRSPSPNQPRLLYKSGLVGQETLPVKIEADIKGASTLWLVVVRGFEKTDRLDAQRAQFDRVAESDQGGPVETVISEGVDGEVIDGEEETGLGLDLLDQSLEARRKLKDHNRKLKFKPPPIPQYQAVWSNPVVLNRRGEKILLVDEKTQQPSLYLDEGDLVEDIQGKDGEDVGEESNEDVPQQGIFFGDDAIRTRAFSAIKYNVKDLDAAKFRATVSLRQDQIEKRVVNVEFWVVSDLPVRSAFLEATPFMLAMGRPRREQISTRRDSVASTMQALEVLSGDAFTRLIERSARSMANKEYKNKDELIVDIFMRLLGREPIEGELEAARFALQGDAVKSDSVKGDESITISGVQDLLWSIVVLPEFQLIT